MSFTTLVALTAQLLVAYPAQLKEWKYSPTRWCQPGEYEGNENSTSELSVSSWAHWDPSCLFLSSNWENQGVGKSKDCAAILIWQGPRKASKEGPSQQSSPRCNARQPSAAVPFHFLTTTAPWCPDWPHLTMFVQPKPLVQHCPTEI